MTNVYAAQAASFHNTKSEYEAIPSTYNDDETQAPDYEPEEMSIPEPEPMIPSRRPRKKRTMPTSSSEIQEEAEPQPQAPTRSTQEQVKRSSIWNHFTQVKVLDDDGNEIITMRNKTETVSLMSILLAVTRMGTTADDFEARSGNISLSFIGTYKPDNVNVSTAVPCFQASPHMIQVIYTVTCFVAQRCRLKKDN